MDGMEKELDMISGSVDSVIYSNDENGYTVLRLNLDGGGQVTVVGTLPFAAPGELLSVEGEWTSHQVHGSQFKAQSFLRSLPSSSGLDKKPHSTIIIDPLASFNRKTSFFPISVRFLSVLTFSLRSF